MDIRKPAHPWTATNKAPNTIILNEIAYRSIDSDRHGSNDWHCEEKKS